MSDASWYTVAVGPDLLQGDILLSSLVYTVGPIPVPVQPGYAPDVDVETHDLIVLTQSCDLANDKVDRILLAKVSAWSAVVAGSPSNSHLRSTEYRKKLVEGGVPGYSLLARCDDDPSLPWSVVDFHRLFVLAKPYVTDLAASRSPRLRLRSPYLEHLSQSFARYFMRVGLPLPLNDFITGGK